MPTGYQIKDQSSAYYLTFQVVFWIDLFTYPKYRDVVIESFKYCQQEKGLEIFAWVIMSNHIHLLARSKENNLSDTIRDFKKFTSKAFIELITTSGDSRKEWMLRLFQHAAKRQNKEKNFQVWTHENHAIEVYGNSFIQTKIDYIHENPVRAGIVRKNIDYKYSSACIYADQPGLLDIIMVGSTWRTVK
jgi:REP element-mobilizing transposase RayT